MSSISDPPPPVSTPTFASDQLHYQPTVTGKEIIDDTRVTINDYMLVTKTASQNSKELFVEVEQQKAELASDQGMQLALEASSYARLINALRNTYDTFSVNAHDFSAPTAGVNSHGSTLNDELAVSSNADAVTAYNQAVTDFTAAKEAFDASPQTQTDIDTYNTAIAAFNTASSTFNTAMTTLNSDIDAYNAAVQDYNDQIIASQPALDAENADRALQGLPPLEPRPSLPTITNVTGATLLTYPPGASVAPTPAVLPPLVTADLIDYNDQSFGDVLQDSGFISEQDAFKNFVDRTTDYQNYTTEDLSKKPQKQVKGITQSDAYIQPEESSAHGSGGSAGTAALSDASTTPGEQKIQGVLTKTLIKLLMTNRGLPENLGVASASQALAATFFTNTVQPSLDAASLNENLVVSSLATLAGGVAQSQSGNIEATVTAFVQNAAEFKNLNAADKKVLAEGLSAAIKTAVLTLGAAGLAGQLGGASALEPALASARIQANPSAEFVTFGQVQKAFNETKETFGNENVAATVSKLITEELIKGGVNSHTAFKIGNATGSHLAQDGFGSGQKDLVALLQTSAQSVTGETLPDEQASKLARALLLLGLGSAFQLNAQGNLVQKLQPETAANLVEQSTIRLFGFSPNFGQATIARRENEPKEELSFSYELEKQLTTFRDAGDKKVLEVVEKQLDNFTKTVDDLGSFLVDQLMNPGHTFDGLMYGDRGTEFRRGQIDVNV